MRNSPGAWQQYITEKQHFVGVILKDDQKAGTIVGKWFIDLSTTRSGRLPRSHLWTTLCMFTRGHTRGH